MEQAVDHRADGVECEAAEDVRPDLKGYTWDNGVNGFENWLRFMGFKGALHAAAETLGISISAAQKFKCGALTPTPLLRMKMQLVAKNKRVELWPE